jgi:hypothetical protein
LISVNSGTREEVCEVNFIRSRSVEVIFKSDRFGVISFIDEHLFGALVKLRLWLEQKGYLLACNAARIDAYPSAMSLEMGGGRKLYVLTPGIPTNREGLVDALGAAPINAIGTVAEQRLNYENWLRSLNEHQ